MACLILLDCLTLRNVGNHYQAIRYDVPEDNNTAVRTLNFAPPLPKECESRHMSVAHEYCTDSCRAERLCAAETSAELRYMYRYERVPYLFILILVRFSENPGRRRQTSDFPLPLRISTYLLTCLLVYLLTGSLTCSIEHSSS